MAETTPIEEEARAEEADTTVTVDSAAEEFEAGSEGTLWVWDSLIEIGLTSGFITTFQPDWSMDTWTYLDSGDLGLEYAGTLETLKDGDVGILTQIFVTDTGLTRAYQYYNYMASADQEISFSYDEDLLGVVPTYSAVESANLAERFGGTMDLSGSLGTSLSELTVLLGQLPDSKQIDNYVPKYLLYPEWATSYNRLETITSLTSSAATVASVTESY